MLINCVVYENGRKLADIEVDDIGAWLHRPGCFVWVALRDATDDELRRMQQQFDLHELAVEDARHGHQRPKVEEYGDMVFVVMHLLDYEGPFCWSRSLGWRGLLVNATCSSMFGCRSY